MKHSNFNYKTPNKKEIVKHILYENAIFDIKDIFSDNISDETCAVSIITPTQMVSVTFPYSCSPAGHAGMAHYIKELVYPNEANDFYLGQRIYLVERVDNLFITCTKDGIIIIPPEQNKMTECQYNLLCNYLEELSKSEYAKTGRLGKIYIAQDLSDDMFIDIKNIDKELEKLKSNIIDKKLLREENPINKLDFSDCKTEEEILARAEIYAKQFVETRKIVPLEQLDCEITEDNQGR